MVDYPYLMPDGSVASQGGFPVEMSQAEFEACCCDICPDCDSCESTVTVIISGFTTAYCVLANGTWTPTHVPGTCLWSEVKGSGVTEVGLYVECVDGAWDINVMYQPSSANASIGYFTTAAGASGNCPPDGAEWTVETPPDPTCDPAYTGDTLACTLTLS